MKITSIMRVMLTRSLKPFVFSNIASKRLNYEQTEPLGLYIHIPFCRTICNFCPYCKVKYQQDLADNYKQALMKEIALVGGEALSKKKVSTLYFGGGTPATMLLDLKDIIDCVNNYFSIEDGIGVELHPDDICEETLWELKRVGVTMISIGIQSFQKESLSALGRVGGGYIELFELIQKVGFDTVDVDLIFAIPNQTIDSLIKDIELAFRYGATQISTYPFIDFTYTNNEYKPLSEKMKKKMLIAVTNYCEEMGYDRTSVWTFALKDTVKYSSVTRENFLGFGVSATTLLKNEFKINTFMIEDYINKIDDNSYPTSLTLKFSRRQRAVYYLFWSAYSMRVDEVHFKRIFNQELRDMYGFELFLCKLLGFVEQSIEGFRLTNRGAYYYHLIEQIYTTEYIDKMWNISMEEAFPKKIVLK